MKCIIIEDEFPAQKVLENYIEKTNSLTCIGVFDTPNKVPFDILNQCDLIFLDIQMPEINGLEFLKSYRFKAKVIVTTAYREYAIDAFEENVADYFLKPFSYARFLKGVTRVEESFTTTQNTDEIFVYTDKTFHKLNINEISIIQAQVDYINIFFNNQKLLVQDSLNRWEDAYKNSSLLRVHRSYIINLKKIEKIQGNQIFIDNLQIPIGKTYKDILFKIIKL
ncbi:MAG TPA: LytTR family DNA-binding domain-containing protein [Flavobacterium sp.]|jgi:DNA-binding LytR/AlgR family response regulator